MTAPPGVFDPRPDDPRPWNTADLSLRIGSRTPHEMGCVLRLHHAGWPGREIVQKLKTSTPLFEALFYRAQSLVNGAKARRVVIHSATVPKGTK